MVKNKYSGSVNDFQLVVEDQSRIVVSYGLEVGENDMATWYEVVFYKKQQGKPTIAQVKAAIMEDINNRVKDKIISGFVYNEQPVWLSEENQMNFAQAVVPTTFKTGEQEDGTPIYNEFNTKKDLQQFVEACVRWKQECLSWGWTEKDSIDWAPYEQALEALTPETAE